MMGIKARAGGEFSQIPSSVAIQYLEAHRNTPEYRIQVRVGKFTNSETFTIFHSIVICKRIAGFKAALASIKSVYWI